MEVYDNVILNTNLNDLSERGIRKGCTGVVLEIDENGCFVRFRNRENIGDYACVYVNEQYLDKFDHEPENHIPTWEKFKKTNGIKKDSFQPRKFFENDVVEVAVEKEQYAKLGVHKGMQGIIMLPECICGNYYVVFSDENTVDDIADITVHEDDLILIKR